MIEVHQNKDGKWYFWNETYSDEIGPYDSYAECRRKSREYVNYLDSEEDVKERDWPETGEIYIALDPQNRLGVQTWLVARMGDGTLQGDTIQLGLFWKIENARIFAKAYYNKHIEPAQNRITEEIKQAFIHYKRNNPSETIDDAAPFTGDHLWMNYYLFPEVLQIYDEWAEEYKVFNLVARSGEAIMFPCWVLTNKVVIRIMEECGIILREES